MREADLRGGELTGETSADPRDYGVRPPGSEDGSRSTVPVGPTIIQDNIHEANPANPTHRPLLDRAADFQGRSGVWAEYNGALVKRRYPRQAGVRPRR